MLIDDIIEFCDNNYNSHHCNCELCDRVDVCKHNCKKCLDDIHYHENKIRSDYDCNTLLDYYVCRYSQKYSSEIIYALQQVDLNKYINFDILSLGCGGAADLMAFDTLCGNKINSYCGLDINNYWNNIHNEIQRLSPYATNFYNTDVLNDLSTHIYTDYNVIIIEYLISFLYPDVGVAGISNFFDNIIESIVSHKRNDTPMLIIINDVDSCNTGRDTFKLLVDKLTALNYTIINYKRKRFYSTCHYSNSEQYLTDANCYEIYDDFQEKYCVAKYCTSAQLIIEVE